MIGSFIGRFPCKKSLKIILAGFWIPIYKKLIRIRIHLTRNNGRFIPDKIKEIKSETSSLAFFLLYISAKRRNIETQNSGIKFFTYHALKIGTGTYPAYKNELLQKSWV